MIVSTDLSLTMRSALWTQINQTFFLIVPGSSAVAVSWHSHSLEAALPGLSSGPHSKDTQDEQRFGVRRGFSNDNVSSQT